MKLILEKWQKFTKESQLSPDFPDIRDGFDNMNDRYWDRLERRYSSDLKKIGLDFEDYKRFSLIYFRARNKYIPIEQFIENMKDPVKKQKMIDFDPDLDKTKADQGQKFSSAPSKQRVEKMYNALRQMDGQMSGEKYEKAVAALNDLLRSI